MLSTDVRFRNVIADLQAASLGVDLQKALSDYDEALNPLGPSIDPVRPDPSPSPPDPDMSSYYGWTGALPILYISHYENVRDKSDPAWSIPPVIGPGDQLVDWNPDDPESELIDQDGNPVHV